MREGRTRTMEELLHLQKRRKGRQNGVGKKRSKVNGEKKGRHFVYNKKKKEKVKYQEEKGKRIEHVEDKPERGRSGIRHRICRWSIIKGE